MVDFCLVMMTSNDRQGTFSRPLSITFHNESVFFHFFLIKYIFLVESDGQGTAKGLLSIITRW